MRFLFAGAVNTGLTIALYQVALPFVGPSLAYAVAWLAGLVFVAVVYPDKVFKGGRSGPADRAWLAGSYIAVFLFGLLALELVQRAGLSAQLAIIVVTVLTTVVNFGLSRALLRHVTRGARSG